MARHAGGRVVHNQHRDVALVIAGGCQARHPTVEKRGIPNNGQRLSRKIAPFGLFGPMRHGNAGTHANGGIHRSQRRRGTQRIATDISKYRQPHLFEHVKHTAMRTSSAQCRRTGGQILDIGQSRRIHALYYLLYQVCAQLARFANT